MSVLRIFVLLPRQQGMDGWQQQAMRQEMPDLAPYGYHHAASEQVQVTFSRATPWTWFARCLKWVLRVDVAHVWHHRHAVRDCDVVWTHTEHEHLPLLLLLRLARWRRPRVIAQCIWLFDDWVRLSIPTRAICRWLLRRADRITVHCDANRQRAARCIPGLPVHVMPFGISLEVFPLRKRGHYQPCAPLRILAAGNDRDRDWPLLASAVGNQPGLDVVVASAHFPADCARPNIRVVNADVVQMKQLYDWADLVLMPLCPNAHVSGMTVVLEAVALGVPVVCADAGGLREFFPDSALWYFRAGDGADLRRALHQRAKDPDEAARRVEYAQHCLQAAGLSSREWADRHVCLSYEACGAHRPRSCGVSPDAEAG